MTDAPPDTSCPDCASFCKDGEVWYPDAYPDGGEWAPCSCECHATPSEAEPAPIVMCTHCRYAPPEDGRERSCVALRLKGEPGPCEYTPSEAEPDDAMAQRSRKLVKLGMDEGLLRGATVGLVIGWVMGFAVGRLLP